MPIASIRRIAVAASVAAALAVPTTVAMAPAASASAASASVASVSVAGPAAVAKPAQPYPPTGRLFVNRVTFAGGPVVFVGTGFFPRELVTAQLDGVVRDTDRANRVGIVSGRFTVPRSTTPGTHSFSLTGTRSGYVLSTTITVRRLPRRSAQRTAVKIDAAPVANRVAPAQKAPAHTAPAGTTQSAVGVAALLGALGCGTYFVARRRRAHSSRG